MTNKNSNTLAFFNGEYMPLDQVCISPLDRGFLLGDSIYEAIPFYSNKALGAMLHYQRLMDGLQGVGIDSPYPLDEWPALIEPVLFSNEASQLVYIQVTRGDEQLRKHRFPIECPPTVLAFSIPFSAVVDESYQGCAAHLQEDLRWQRCNIKSTSLMGNVLAYRKLFTDGVANDEALLVRNGLVVEAPSSNLFMAKDGVIYTPPVDNILPGVSRALVIDLAQSLNFDVIEQSPDIEMLKAADEVWITNSMEELKPITSIDGRQVGSGVPGNIWSTLFRVFQKLKDNAL